MKSAELWNCDNLSKLQRLPRKRTLLTEAQVGSRFMVVAQITRQRSLEMSRVHDDVVVQTFPSNRADESLGVWILPWTMWCCQNLLHAQRLDSQSNLSTVPAVPIADEVMRSLSVANASTIWCAVQAPVGCSVTLKCSTLRRSCSKTINTNSILMVIVGTVKKSIDTIWPTWLRRKVLQVWWGGRVSPRRMRDTVRSEMAMPSILSSP